MTHARLVRGFTLLEMVVVIAILAVLATVAIKSVDGRVDQSRYETTQRQLQEIEDATLGPQNVRQPDGTLLASGFLSDVGRLPLSMPAIAADGTAQLNGDGVQAYQPAELWSTPNSLQAFSLVQATELDPSELNGGTLASPQDVFVPCGWRGPYLRMSPGTVLLKDGWGSFFDMLKPDRTFAQTSGTTNFEAAILRSRGMDGEIDGAAPNNDYRDDLYSAFKTNAFTAYPTAAAGDRCTATVFGAIHIRDATTGDLVPPLITDGSKILVKYFGPDPATGGAKRITAVLTVTAGAEATYTLADPAITAGSRLLRAYQVKDDGSAIKKSSVIRITLAAGGNSQDFILK